MNREKASTMGLVAARNAAAITTNTTTVGNVIDTQGFDSLTVAFQSAARTDGTYTPVLQECDTSGGTYTDVADSDMSVLESSAAISAANTVTKIGYLGTKRYVKPSIVSTGVTTGATIGALAILEGASQQPVA